MPGMAEPDIVVDLDSASSMSKVPGTVTELFSRQTQTGLRGTMLNAALLICLLVLVVSLRANGVDWGVWSSPTMIWLPLAAALGLICVRHHAAAAPRDQPRGRAVIIGMGGPIQELLPRFRSGAMHGLRACGVIENRAASERHPNFLGISEGPNVGLLEHMIRHDNIDSVVIALPWGEAEQIRTIVERIAMTPVDIFIYPGASHWNQPPLLVAGNRPIQGIRARIKRIEDVILASLAIIFISPVLLLIAAGIKLTSRGPVLFRQRRLGYNNRVIEVLKFRSMYTHLADADARQQALRGDKRVTPFGAWLRRTSLDELPQLFNVLKGDMSLVGPRPHALATTAGGLALEEAAPDYAARHRVKPGITGLAQVNGYRGALDSVDKIVHRVNHDLYYIENWSLRLDLKILWQTARLVLSDHNAF